MVGVGVRVAVCSGVEVSGRGVDVAVGGIRVGVAVSVAISVGKITNAVAGIS
jgi:hypothetical protein